MRMTLITINVVMGKKRNLPLGLSYLMSPGSSDARTPRPLWDPLTCWKHTTQTQAPA